MGKQTREEREQLLHALAEEVLPLSRKTLLVDLHILECDAAVHRDTVITSPEELTAFTAQTTLHGRGGTDFRPAFRYLDELMNQGELTELRGVLYLSDGDGVYPEETPRYETAFLFVSREDAETQVPPWAIPVLLDGESLSALEILYLA